MANIGRRVIRATVIALTFACPAARGQGPAPAFQRKAELKQYYDQKGYPAAWTAAVADLAAADGERHEPAARKLVAVLAQALADERDGTAPWRATPFWGKSGENPARELRDHLLHELAEPPAKPGAVRVVRWYISHDPIRGHQTAAMRVLAPVTTPAADALRLDVLKAPPENARVTAAALRQARERNLAVSEDVLTAFARHHRASIRTVAAAWLAAEKKPVPAFDPAAAVRADPAKKVVERITDLWPDAPAGTSMPLAYRERYLRDDGVTVNHGPDIVWPLRESKADLTVVDLHGRYRTYAQSNRNGEPKGAGQTTWRTEPADVEAAVKEVVAVRAKGDPDFALSAGGGLTGQFEGHGPSLKELLLGVWLCRANRHDLAAAVLLPAFDAADSDTAVVDVARHQLAIAYGQEMLWAFTHHRDYPEALRLATLTEKLYPRTTYSEHAKRLARELPLRKDDFGAFALPTPAEWAALKPTLDRGRQIDYLCARLRLLNCFQHGQPGGVDYADNQYKEPGVHGDEQPKGTVVINPLVELAGDNGDEWQKRPKVAGLRLTLADVPTLAAHLKDDWTMVMVSYWRDFHPSRELHTTRAVLADLIHDLAKQDICHAKAMNALPPREIERHIAAIQTWAKDRAGRSEADLHVEALDRAVREDERWSWNASANARALAELKDRRVFPPAVRFLERNAVEESDFADVLKEVAPLDPARFKPFAVKMLKFEDRRDQLWAACLLVAAGDTAMAFDRIEGLLPTGKQYGAWHWRYALEVLMAAKGDRPRTLVGKIVSGRKLLEPPGEVSSWELRRDFVPKLYAGGFRDHVLRFYSALLDDTTPRWQPEDKDFRNNDAYAGELLAFLKASDESLRKIADRPGKPREKIPALKAWIAATLAAPKK